MKTFIIFILMMSASIQIINANSPANEVRLAAHVVGGGLFIMKNETEIWKDIPGYEGLYQVSNLGKVVQCKKNKCLTLSETTKGYLRAYVYKDGEREAFSVHRLVAKLFIPNPENKPEVNHKFGNKKDNRWHQLEWTTTKENVIHSFEVLNRVAPKGEKNKLSKPVEQLSLSGEIVNTFCSTTEARKSGAIDAKALNRCLKGEISSARGFLWRFKSIA